MEEILIPIAICVVLPVMIVWLINRTRQNETNRKTEIMLKAIESGATIDADFFKAQQEQKPPKTLKEKLLNRLTAGCVFTLMGVAFALIGLVNRSMMADIHMSNDAFIMPCILGGIFFSIGVALLIGFFVGKKMLAKEMEAEAKALEQK